MRRLYFIKIILMSFCLLFVSYSRCGYAAGYTMIEKGMACHLAINKNLNVKEIREVIKILQGISISGQRLCLRINATLSPAVFSIIIKELEKSDEIFILVLSNNAISQEHVRKIIDILKHNRQLANLSFLNVTISDADIHLLIRELTIYEFRLSMPSINVATAHAIADALAHNTTLGDFYIVDSNIDPEAVMVLVQNLVYNNFTLMHFTVDVGENNELQRIIDLFLERNRLLVRLYDRLTRCIPNFSTDYVNYNSFVRSIMAGDGLERHPDLASEYIEAIRNIRDIQNEIIRLLPAPVPVPVPERMVPSRSTNDTAILTGPTALFDVGAPVLPATVEVLVQRNETARRNSIPALLSMGQTS